MFRFAKNTAAALALTGLVLSQPALAVRSSDSLPAPGAKISAVNGRLASPVRTSEDAAGVPMIGFVIAGLVLLSVILIISSDNKNKNVSPG